MPKKGNVFFGTTFWPALAVGLFVFVFPVVVALVIVVPPGQLSMFEPRFIKLATLAQQSSWPGVERQGEAAPTIGVSSGTRQEKHFI